MDAKKFKIGIIRNTPLNLDRLGEYILPLLHKPFKKTQTLHKQLNEKLNNYIWDILKEFIEIVEISVDELHITHVELVHKTYTAYTYEQLLHYTEESFCTPNTYVEFMHSCIPGEIRDNYVSPYQNLFGCYMSVRQNVIHGDVIALAYDWDLKEKNKVQIKDITEKDLIRVIKRRFLKSAFLVTIKNELIKYYYEDPAKLAIDVFDLDISPRFVRSDILKYHLVFCQGDAAEGLSLNTTINKINKNIKLYGNILLFNELESTKDNMIKTPSHISFTELEDILRFYATKIVDNSTIVGDNNMGAVDYWDKFLLVRALKYNI